MRFSPSNCQSPLSEASGERVFVSYLRDITKEIEAEEELRFARDKAQADEKAKSDLLTVMSHENANAAQRDPWLTRPAGSGQF